MVLVKLFVFAKLPVHPIGLTFEESPSEAWLDLASVHCGENGVIGYWGWRVWIRPSWSTVFSGVVLMSHYVHLVEMNLWYVGVGGGVYAFGWDHGDNDGLGFVQSSFGDMVVDIGDGGDGHVVDGDDVAFTQ